MSDVIFEGFNTGTDPASWRCDRCRNQQSICEVCADALYRFTSCSECGERANNDQLSLTNDGSLCCRRCLEDDHE